uniref:Double-GTPase 2 domain-containing protein n=1 Tax=Candidatus Kentrum sp. FW TaxID=2126338 RepID=A0A450TWU3_9GAMM|nr:MAG: hypothetical protein BECKFW1821C_GA0114237_10534 [Candidatus Kentron sp. FW]
MPENDDIMTTCSNPDCRVAETGKCVEGFEFSECPHYGKPLDIDDGDEDEEVSEEEEKPQSPNIRLPGADLLVPADASKLLRAGKVRVIAIIGPADSGKTSLIASLYDLFQEGPVSGTEYARSLTLHAFERTCHDARAASRRCEPDTGRTPRGEVRFFHLQLRGSVAGEGVALVLGDRAGEEYRSAADDPSIAAEFSEIKRADAISILVDGERLLDSGARHNVRSEIAMMLQAVVEEGAVQNGQRLSLVLTKDDLIQESPHGSRAETDFSNLLSEIQGLFGAVFSEIKLFRTAASPKTGNMHRGTGVPDLLAFWMEPACPAPTAPRAKPAHDRAFARLLPLDEENG